MQTLVTRGRRVSGNCIRHGGSDESRNDKSMTAGRFCDKNNGGEWCFVACGQKRGHAHRSIKIDAGTVDDRLRKRGSNAPAGQKQRDEHGTHSTSR